MGPEQAPVENEESELSESERDLIDSSFARGALLYDDIRSVLENHATLMAAGDFNVGDYPPVPTYEEYFTESSARYPDPEARYRYIMKKSDPEAVARYNARVAKFNSDLERIVLEKDAQAITDFYRDINDLIRGPGESAAA